MSTLSYRMVTSSAMVRATVVAVIAVIAIACGAAPKTVGLDTLRAACQTGAVWNGETCVAWGQGQKRAAVGEAQLEEGQVDEAIVSIKTAAGEGPHSHATHVRIFEQLGIAYSYREDETKAKEAFRQLLLLQPRHLLSYNLSPRATLKFEQARAAIPGEPALDVSWPIDVDVTKPIPVSVEVVSDPSKMLKRATLFVRETGGPLRAADVALAPPGERAEIVLPPLGGTSAKTLGLHLVAQDAAGSEVLLWASETKPRRLQVDYTPPTPLLKKWWFWAAVGSVVAAGAGTTVYFLTREPPEILDMDDVVAF